MEMEILEMSREGTVRIPEGMRKEMGLSGGSWIAILVDPDSIMLKPIRVPTVQDFKAWMDEARDWAEEAGYREEDVSGIVKEFRRGNQA